MAVQKFTIFNVRTGEISRVVECLPILARHQCDDGEYFRPGGLDDRVKQVDPYHPFGPAMDKDPEAHTRCETRVAKIPSISHQVRLLMDYVLAAADRNSLPPAALKALGDIEAVVAEGERLETAWKKGGV